MLKNSFFSILFWASLCPLYAKTLKYRHIPSRFESAHSIALDAQIENGILLSNSGQEIYYKEEIVAQLFYLVGMLNARQGVAELAHLKLKISSVEPPGQTGYSRVHYSVSFVIGWNRASKIPAQMTLPFPLQSDEDGIRGFFKNHKKSCSTSASEPDLTPTSFYYYFRPEKSKCRLLGGKAKDAVLLNLKLSVSPSNTENKSPEYAKVWEDGKLVATLIVGTDVPDATENSDVGVTAYNKLVKQAQDVFGKPDWIVPNLLENELPGMAHPDVEMEFTNADGKKINLNFLLIDKHLLQNGSPIFEKRYNERTRISDFVSYNGHSGFGENIRALAKMGHFEKGQYQLYYVNGCDTFAYVDDALALAHQKANPGSGLYEYFDIITNAMPSSFTQFGNSNFAILSSLASAKNTYREILSKFQVNQKAIVMGEEDNRWPDPF